MCNFVRLFPSSGLIVLFQFNWEETLAEMWNYAQRYTSEMKNEESCSPGSNICDVYK